VCAWGVVCVCILCVLRSWWDQAQQLLLHPLQPFEIVSLSLPVCREKFNGGRVCVQHCIRWWCVVEVLSRVPSHEHGVEGNPE
jgi:hypothetical protein